tara:strand:+ start:233 stop:1030 length:798 start_codon:yes stop_codon:yes gene_type:complete
VKIFNRYKRVISQFLNTSILTEFEYSFNLIVEIFSVFGNSLGSLFIISIFYSNNNTLGGWPFYSSIIILGIYSILEGVTITILYPNLRNLVSLVQEGTLDFILLKPINPQFWLSLRTISPWGLPSFVVGILLIVFGILKSNFLITPLNIILFSILLLTSVIILYSLWFIIATTTIWFVKIWNASEVLRSILVAGRFPIDAYPYSLRTLFTFIIPIAFLTSLPAKILIGTSNIIVVISSIVVAASFFIFSLLFWRFSLRFYTSASS